MTRIVFSEGSKAWANNLNDLRERWQIRREDPVKFVVPTRLFNQDLRKLTREDLLNLKVELIELQDKGKKELLKHQNIKRYEGISLEPDKYSDLFFTIRSIGSHIQEVNHALSKYQQKYKESLGHIFMDVCRERLPKETWSELMKEANDRLRADGKGKICECGPSATINFKTGICARCGLPRR